MRKSVKNYGIVGDGEEVGTGCAGRWGNHSFILTASHVINKRAMPSDLRVFWRPTGNIERRSDADLTRRDILDGVPIRDPKAVIYRCSWEDLAVVVIDPSEAGPYAEFFDVANDWTDPPQGEIVSSCGFPIDKHLLIDKRMVGNKEERTIALRPEIFNGHVLPQPTEQELKFQITAYDRERHYLVPYEHPKGKHPNGFSGAATWWESDKHQIVWRPNLKFAGLCTSCYRKGSVLQVVKASVVHRFLEQVFGTGRADEGALGAH